MDAIDWLAVNNGFHTLVGSAGLLGGAVALWATKGSPLHVRGGWVFAWAMAPVVATSLAAMFNVLLPLAIVLAVAELYLLPSALLALRGRGARAWQVALLVLAVLIATTCTLQFARFALGGGRLLLGALALAAVFWWLAAQDLRALRTPRLHPNARIRRHLARMILAFTIAVMALVRIGIRFGVSLEATVVVPLVLAVLAILWVQRRYPVPADSAPRRPSPSLA